MHQKAASPCKWTKYSVTKFFKDLVILKDLREKVVKEEVTVLSFSIETLMWLGK